MRKALQMSISKWLAILALIAGSAYTSNAQLVCPPNIDFERGDLTGWSFFTGSYTGGTPTADIPSAPIACRHTLTKTSGLIGCTTPAVAVGPIDQYGGFPVVAPGGGSYSMRIGNQNTGRETEKARFYVPIPPGSDNYSLIYRYAVVFQSPCGHTLDQMPQFVVTVFDSAATTMSGGVTPVLIGDSSCSYFQYVPDPACRDSVLTAQNYLRNASCPTCSPAASAGSFVLYKSWATATVDLSGLAGTTVGIDFMSVDCSLGGHFGYGYIDMNCGLFRISAAMCDTNTPPVLSAPEGFQSYQWLDSATYTVSYGTGRVVTVDPFPSSPVTIAVILTPFPGYGCPDTLFTRISPSALALNPSNDTAICRGRSTVLYSNATDIATPLYYNWSPAAGLSCTNCPAPVATPTATTAYTLVVTNANGCTQEHVYNITILPDVVTTVTVDTPTCNGYSDAEARVAVTAGSGEAPFYYTWSTAPVQTTSLATGLTAGSYTVIVVDNLGCTDTNVAVILDPAPRTIDVDTFFHPSRCLASDGRIEFIGSFQRDTSYTIRYHIGGVPYTRTVLATVDGRLILNALAQGTYTDITIIGALCVYDSTGPVTLLDPSTPDLTGVTSNSFICEGDTLKLFASSTTPGAVFSWEGPGGYLSGLPNPIIAPATMANAGVYSVTVSRADCYNYATTLVEIRPLPIPIGSSNTPVCSSDTLYLTATSTNGATSYRWDGPDMFTSFDQNPFVAHVQTVSTGVYTLTITLDGCLATDTANVIVNQTPEPPLFTNLNYCQWDNAVALSGIGTNLTWYTEATGGVGSAVAPVPATNSKANTTWYATQTSAEGCTSGRSAVTVRVWEYPRPQLLMTDTIACGGTYVTFTGNNMGEGLERITVKFTDMDSIVDVNPVKHAFNTWGTFTVSASAYYNYCPDTVMSRTISIFPYASFELGGDTTICPGSEAITLLPRNLNTFGASATWLWNTGEKTPSINVLAPGIYRATASINGCETTDSVIVKNDCFIDIPNIFTPNGDGMNDFFFPRAQLSRGLIQFSINIYNRWGQLVFTSNALEGRGWDGNFNGVPQPESVYVYEIKAQFKDGQKESHTGNITLLR